MLAQEGLTHLIGIAIEDFAHLRGALVRDFPLKGCEGRLTRLGGRAIISVNSSLDYEPRRRFVIAHEIGHLELHEKKNQLELSLCDEERISELYDQGTEQEANAFASELLMPTEVWHRKCDVTQPTLDRIAELAQEFGVSFTAAAIRFSKLSGERCCVVYSQDGVVKWAVAGPEFDHWIERGIQLRPATLASDYFRKGACRREPEEVAASAWLDAPRARYGEIWEHSRVISSQKAVLSLLWIPEGVDF
ncbi:ImmA/IrrE family metallo-endopeptidase [Cystobacter fuscus]|uniref:ImmA/IrrE family metallo-endopeptidase n=1 Tax=Cystobacter fuscus TaxID=43 RepID=UPI0037C04818